MAERRLGREERIIKRSPVARPVPQSSPRIGQVDLGLDGVERRAVRAFSAARQARPATADMALPFSTSPNAASPSF
jgi:hypothetical protein